MAFALRTLNYTSPETLITNAGKLAINSQSIRNHTKLRRRDLVYRPR